MQRKYHFSPFDDKIYCNIAWLIISSLHNPRFSPHCLPIIQTSFYPATFRPPLCTFGRPLVRTVISSMLMLDISIVENNMDPRLPPWSNAIPTVSYTSASKSDLPQVQNQVALETSADMSPSLRVTCHLYTDGSFGGDGSAECAVFSPPWWHRKEDTKAGDFLTPLAPYIVSFMISWML